MSFNILDYIQVLNYDDGVAIYGFSSNLYNIPIIFNIPGYISGIPVRAIITSAFQNFDVLQLNLPNKIKYLGYNIFINDNLLDLRFV